MGAKRIRPKVQVTCSMCGVSFEVSNSQYNHVKRESKQFRCKACYKIWRKNEWYKSLPEEKRKEWSSKRSELSKKVWKDMDPKKKQEIIDKNSIARKNRSPEEKLRTKLKIQNTWKNKSPEEKAAYAAKQAAITKAFWDSLDEKGLEEMSQKMSEAQRRYFDSLSNQDRIIRAMIIRDASREYWETMSEEEYQRRIEDMRNNRKNEWKNASPEEIESRIRKISIGRKRFWDNMPDDIRSQISSNKVKWWNDLSRDKYQEYMYEFAKEWNEHHDSILTNECEVNFMILLKTHNIPFDTQHFNLIKHPDFDEEFPMNPENGSVHISPYHKWDFIITTNINQYLIDIDGSIHKGEKFDKIQFRDSQRPYQTDGLDAYYVECYDDTLTMNSVVINIITDERITVYDILMKLSAECLSDNKLKDLKALLK